MELEKLDIHAHLPVGLVRKVDSYVVRGYYSTRTELIADSLRRRIEELEKREGTEPNTAPHAPIARDSNHMVIANER